MSGVTGLKATDIEIESNQAYCNRSPDGYVCEFSSAVTDITLKVFNYKKQNEILAACSLTLSPISSGTDANGRGFTYFNLSPSPALDATVSHDVSIQTGGCGVF